MRTDIPGRSAGTAFLLAALVAAPAHADAVGDAVEAAVRPLMKAEKIPGMAVGVSVGGEARVFSFGTAAPKTGEAVSEETLFEIGSISKAFTGTLGAWAEARGALDLSDPAEKYRPELEGSAIGRTSLADLATYAAGGLPLQFPGGVEGDRKMLAYYRGFEPAFEAGTRRVYSNPSIGLFGHLAGRALQKPFADAMEDELLPALGLKHTFVRVPEAEMGRYAWGMRRNGKPARAGPGLFDAEAYGIKTTAGDLLAFAQANMEPAGLEPALREAIEATHEPRYRFGVTVQGLGWESYAWPVSLETLLDGNSQERAQEPQEIGPVGPGTAEGPRLFNKTGSTNGFGAYAAFVPERRIAVVVLANRNYPIPARIKAAHAILAALDKAGGTD